MRLQEPVYLFIIIILFDQEKAEAQANLIKEIAGLKAELALSEQHLRSQADANEYEPTQALLEIANEEVTSLKIQLGRLKSLEQVHFHLPFDMY